MIRIAFCDDDPQALTELSELLKRYAAERELSLEQAAYESPLALMDALEQGARWDILLLDILMPGGSGMDLARQIRRVDETVKILFLTNSPEYAVESYTVGAWYYLLKPIVADKLFPVLDRAAEACKRLQGENLIIKAKTGIASVDPMKLEYCEVLGHNLLLHLQDGAVIECKGKLNDLEEKVKPLGCFLRIHRSFLVNMAFIRNISYKAVSMTSGAELPIPHGKFNECKAAYLAYAFERERVLL